MVIQSKEFDDLEKKLIELYKDLPSMAQMFEIQKIKAEYKQKASDLIIDSMKKEIAVLSDVKIKLQV